MPIENSHGEAAAAAPLTSMSGRAFLLHDATAMWLIRSGTMDVFIVPVGAGGEYGARCPIAHMQAGEAVFGIDPGEDAGIVVLGSPGPDTELVSVSLRNLRTPAIGGSEPEGFLDAWVNALYGSVDSTTRPAGFVSLSAMQTVSISSDGSAVSSQNGGVLWIQHQKGSAYFLQRQEFGGIDPQFRFPVSRRGWLFATGKSEIHAIDSRVLLGQGVVEETLQRFHQTFLKYLLASQKEAEDRARARFLTSAKADAALMEDALRGLCVPTRNSRMPGSHGYSIQDATFLACRAVGEHLAIEIKPGQDTRHNQSASDAVESIARASSIRVRRIALNDLWWKYDGGPMVAFLESSGRAVAVLPRPLGGYHLYDPVERTSQRVDAALADTLQPFAYSLYRSLPAKSITVSDLITFSLRPCKKEIGLILLASVASGLLGMITPLCTALIFDSVIPSADRSQLVSIAVFLVTCAISNGLFILARGMVMLRLQIKMNAPLQAAIWDRLLSLPVPFFRDYNSGDLAQRTLGFDEIRKKLTGQTFTTIMSAIFSTFNFALLFYYSWQLALIALLLTTIAVAATSLFGYLQLGFLRQITALRGKLSGMVVQFISGIAKLRISGSEHRAFAAWAREFGEQEQLAFRQQEISNYQAVFGAVFSLICSITTFYAWDAFATGGPGDLTPGQFLAFVAAFGSFMAAMLQLSGSVTLLLSIVPLYERTRPILQALPELRQNQTNPGVLSGRVELSHVSFRYRQDLPLVLKDVSIRADPGEFVAVVGSSGSGKSTLLRLLLGFEKPDAGAVYYDGQDLSGLDVTEVRRQMGVVLQGGSLMRGSILQNIIGSAPLSLSDATEAARLAGIQDDIRLMPMGMHTLVGEGGEGLSGGQRQRLLIARAIVRRPRFLLFDEATSALDNQTQAIVSRSLEGLDTTRIVIAHRLSTIIHADRIFVLDNGVLVQTGTYQQLIAEEGPFKELASRQIT